MSGVPTSPPMARYRDPDATGRLHSDVFLRNGPPLIAALTPWLGARTGPVLEIGAGTGQHSSAFALAFPSLDWQPSDVDPVHLHSIAAWARCLGATTRPPLSLDAADDWASDPEIQGLGPLTAVVALNVVHIAPPEVMRGIVAGAGRTLEPGGLLIFYGPFMVHGDAVGAGNAAFDARLREEDPRWGLRDTNEVEALSRDAGLSPAALVAMPANNRLLILRRERNEAAATV